MNALGTLALFVVAVWMGVLSVVTALLVRQVALLTHWVDPDYALDGLPRGHRIPKVLAELLPDGSGSVLVLGAQCAPCRELAYELRGATIEQPVVAVIEGDEAPAAALAGVLPPDVRALSGEAAARAFSALQLETTPFAFLVEQRQIVDKAVLRGATHFLSLVQEFGGPPTTEPQVRTLELPSVG